MLLLFCKEVRTLEKEYLSYKCKSCKRTFIILKVEMDSKHYLKCPHCSCKDLKKEKETDDLRDCFNHATYKREHGALRQVRQK